MEKFSQLSPLHFRTQKMYSFSQNSPNAKDKADWDAGEPADRALCCKGASLPLIAPLPPLLSS